MTFDTLIEADPLDAPDPVGRAAVVAFAHIVDDCATVEDLTAYRAWVTWLRLTGASDYEVQSSLDVADWLARKLGVA
jgi:hypothetical protein